MIAHALAAIIATAQPQYTYTPSVINAGATVISDGWIYGGTRGRSGGERLLTGEVVELNDGVDYYENRITDAESDGLHLVVSSVSANGHNARGVAFIWSGEWAATWLDQDVYDSTTALAVGDSHIVGGGVLWNVGTHAVAWRLDGLRLVSLHRYSWQQSIATAAEGPFIVGTVIPKGGNERLAVRWGNVRRDEVPTTLPPATGDRESWATGVTRHGRVCGYTVGEKVRACVWDQDGAICVMPEPGTRAVAINGDGIVVGDYSDGHGAWGWDTQTGAVWRLEAAGVEVVKAMDIDEGGRVVVWVAPWPHGDVTSGVLVPKWAGEAE